MIFVEIHAIVVHTPNVELKIINLFAPASRVMTEIQRSNVFVLDVDQIPNALDHMLVLIVNVFLCAQLMEEHVVNELNVLASITNPFVNVHLV